jgi:hypothetical protein
MNNFYVTTSVLLKVEEKYKRIDVKREGKHFLYGWK